MCTCDHLQGVSRQWGGDPTKCNVHDTQQLRTGIPLSDCLSGLLCSDTVGLSLSSARLQCGTSTPGQKGKKKKARQQTAERSAILFTHRGKLPVKINSDLLCRAYCVSTACSSCDLSRRQASAGRRSWIFRTTWSDDGKGTKPPNVRCSTHHPAISTLHCACLPAKSSAKPVPSQRATVSC